MQTKCLAVDQDWRILDEGADMANLKVKSAPPSPPSSRRHTVRPSQRLASALRNAWGPETSFDPAGWSTGNPAWGQCAVTALVVQDHCGGSILSGEVNGIPHYWNRLATNEELDLTLGQFGRSAHHSKVQACDRVFILSYPDTVRRYQQLQQRVSSRLATRATKAAF